MSDTLEQKAETIIGRVLELPVADRPAAAVRACGNDPELLQRVMSLLSAEPAAGGFMDATADSEAAFATSASVGEKPGDSIGRYKLLEKIGEGGFGIVFTAEQQEPVRRLVALKIIKLGMDTREVVARFEAERQALALMDHPNIAKVLDAGATETGRPYFVMELVRGSPITEYADKHKLSTRARAALAAQVCRAVQHAHGKGVIHRDLKPSNVLVTTSDDKPVPKVIDFGIAKATQSRLTDRTLYTAHRQLIGTPQYMSPEQADSDGVDVDTRTDIYSLGVVLYELLVSTTPIDARVLRSAAFDAMRKMIREQDPAKPSTKLATLAGEAQMTVAATRGTNAKVLAQQLHGELDWIVMKALEKERSRRYDTAAAMADDLNRYLNGDAVLAGPISGMYRLKKALGRYKAAAAIGGAIAACLLLGVAGTTYGLLREAQQRRIADSRRADAERQQAEADRQRSAAIVERDNTQAVVSFLAQDVLGAALRPTDSSSTTRKNLLTLIAPAELAIGPRFKNRPLIEAAVRQAMGDALLAIGLPQKALPEIKRALDVRRKNLGPDATDTMVTESSYADAMAAAGNLADAKPMAERAWQRLAQLVGPEERVTLGAEATYARVLSADGSSAQAVPLLKHAWDGFVRDLGMPDPRSLALECDYAAALIDTSHPAAAAPFADEAYWESRRTLGFAHPLTYRALNLWCDAADQAGDATAAEVTCGWLEQYHGMGYSPDPAERLVSVWYRHAVNLYRLGKYADAAVLFRKVAATPTFKPDVDRNNRANATALDCDRLAAHPPATAPAVAATQMWPENARQTVAMMESSADGLRHNHQWDAASEMYRKAINYRRHAAQPDPRALADDLGELSGASEQLGKFSEAADEMQEATDLLAATRGASDPAVVNAAQQTADLLDRAGRRSDAAALRKKYDLDAP